MYYPTLTSHSGATTAMLSVWILVPDSSGYDWWYQQRGPCDIELIRSLDKEMLKQIQIYLQETS